MKKHLILLFIIILLSSTMFSGCMKRTTDPHTEIRSLIHNDIQRSYRIHIPPTFQNNGEAALIFVLHGGGGTAEGMENYLTEGGFNTLSEEYGFIVIYPDGYEKHWNDGRKNVSWHDENRTIDDVDFLSTLIDNTIEELNVDPRQVFFCGISNGGQMSYRMACEKTEKIAGIAAVVSSMSEDLFSMCTPTRPLPVCIISGTDDPLVPYNGGEIILFNKTYGKVISANQTVDYWVSHNTCNTTPLLTYLPDHDPNDGVSIRSEKYRDGENGSRVLHYIMEGGGHIWPGGPQYFPERIIGKTCNDIDAHLAICTFFNLTSEVQTFDDVIVKKDAYRVSWSTPLNLLAFDKQQADGFYDISTMKPDGSEEMCLTDTPLFPQGHKGCADWHPSGQYIVFTSQKEHYCGKHTPLIEHALNKLAVPGEGINCDLWIMTINGSTCWQVTDLPTKQSIFDRQPYTGVLHPHFSHDGTQLLWSERIGGGKEWGEWILRVADFNVIDGTPMIDNIVSYQPGHAPCFYESHGFSSDDKSILFSGNLLDNQHVNHLDIYTLDLETQHLVRLTTSEEEWDEHAHFSPVDTKIIWMSSEGYGMNTEKDWWNYLRTDYWMMDHDGSNKTRITFYNEEVTQDIRVICSDCCFSPDGSKLATTMLILEDDVPINGGIGILPLS